MLMVWPSAQALVSLTVFLLILTWPVGVQGPLPQPQPDCVSLSYRGALRWGWRVRCVGGSPAVQPSRIVSAEDGGVWALADTPTPAALLRLR